MRWPSPIWSATPFLVAACVGQTLAEPPTWAEPPTPSASAPEEGTTRAAGSRPAPARATEPAGAEESPRVLSGTEETLAAWIASEAQLVVHVGADGHGGSGTLVSREGHVLTAAHVVDGLRWVDVTLPDGRRGSAQVVRRDDTVDLAVLETQLPVEHCAAPATTRPAIGDWVLVAGFPGAAPGEIPPATSLGLILGIPSPPPHQTPSESSQEATVRPALLTGARIAPGMSGGPALDVHGRLVGVVTATGGRVASLADSSILEALACPAPAREHALLPVIRDATHDEPDRAPSLPAPFAPGGPTHRRDRGDGMQIDTTVRFHASMNVYVEGVVLADGLVMTLADRSFGTVAEPASGVTLVSHPDASVIGPIAIAGELALIRVEHLDAPSIDARAAMPRVGELLASRERLEPGVVSAVAISPGMLTPFIPAPSGGGRHCGTLLAMRYASAPRVEISRAFAHDVPASRGELLVDVTGRPVAIHVGHHVEGLGYAVPLSEARARFEDVLPGGRAAP